MFHRRKQLRFSDHDYTQCGAYFVTMVAKDRARLFGDIADGELLISPLGEIVKTTWLWLFDHFDYLIYDEYCLMPDHFHGILWIKDSSWGGSRTAPTDGLGHIKPLGGLIGAFKTVSTKNINLLRGAPGETVWQRNYYERIIRNDRELDAIRKYIQANPHHWNSNQKN